MDSVEIVSHDSPLLAENPLGDPATREVVVCLPPSYQTTQRRFPVIYFLPGFTGFGRVLLNRSAWVTPMDVRVTQAMRGGQAKEAIVVLPDCFTRYGGSQYVDSPAIGRYQSYLTEELVPLIDRRFR